MFHRAGKQHKFKVEFQVTFSKASQLDKSVNGSTVSIGWKRGKKAVGSTKRALVANGSASWADADTAVFACSCFRGDKAKTFDKKSFKLSLLEDVPKRKPRLLGEASLDLAPFIKSNGIEALSVPLKNKLSSKGPAPTIELVLRSRYVKIDGNKVIGSGDATTDGGKAMQVDGEDFLVKTDSDASQTTVDSASNIDESEYAEVERMFVADGDDGVEQHSSGSGRPSQDRDLEPAHLRDRIEELETESDERWKALQAQTKEVAFVRQQLHKMQQADSERLKALHSLERDKLDLQLQLDALRQHSQPDAVRDHDKLRDRLAQLKTESADKDKRLAALENELSTLKRRLQAGAEAASEPGGELGSKYARLQQEFDEHDALVHKLQHELKAARKKLGQQQPDDPQPTRPAITPASSSAAGRRAEPASNASSAATASGTAGMSAGELRQALDEKSLLEQFVYAAPADFALNVAKSASEVFRALLAWSAFTAPRPKLLTDVADAVWVTAKRSNGDSGGLAYWLSAVYALLSKLRTELASSTASSALARSSKLAAPGAAQRPDPALVSAFETRLQTLARDIFGLLVGSMLREVEPYLLDLLVPSAPHAASPAAAAASMAAVRRAPLLPKKPKASSSSGAKPVGATGGSVPSKMAALGTILNRAFDALINNHLPSPVAECVLRQLFYRIDAALFNELLHRRELLCTSSNGFHVKLSVSQLEAWLLSKTPAFHKLRSELGPILQAATVLVMDLTDPNVVGDKEILAQICPALNAAQVLALVEAFAGDVLCPSSASSVLIERLNGFVRDEQKSNAGKSLPLELDEDFLYDLPDLRTLR
eukprot:TRINITY_DN7124_c0_g1_i1.p1 TRINITY_DN7124_c0_g1~~TRINITY_DN7124_c0_g1_i1.p1  ORF type:complete len:828 (+),score=357.02 TRINITY_DN7124_c0_g1_i1:257-2740(+)